MSVPPANVCAPGDDEDPRHFTELLHRANAGDSAARDELISAIIRKLRRMASHMLCKCGGECTLQPTEVVSELYLKLFGERPGDFANRRHFWRSAAIALKRIRIEDARRRQALKRGGGRNRVALEDPLARPELDPDALIDLEEALERLKPLHPDAWEVAVLRYFGGFTVDQTAEVLGCAPRTVDDLWAFARAWLLRELHGRSEDHPPS